MKKPLTNSELAILSLVAEEPRHGWQIQEVIEERGMREWTEIGFSSIYHILGVLERRGLIKSALEPAEGRGAPRRVYRVVPAGRRAYQAGVMEALSAPQRLFPLIHQGLAGLPAIPPLEAAEALETYAASLRARLAGVVEKSRRELPYHVVCMFEYSVRMIHAEIEWAEDLSAELRARAGRPAMVRDGGGR